MVVNDLTFRYAKKAPSLKGVSLSLPYGSRTLLVGDNGAGKSTLLKILSGSHLTPGNTITVLGKDSYFDTTLNQQRAYCATDWGKRTVAFAGSDMPLMADIAVCEMMAALQKEFRPRRDELVALLGIDLDWRMHELSDGQRRRVQIMLQLLRPVKVLLLDEITTVRLCVCVVGGGWCSCALAPCCSAKGSRPVHPRASPLLTPHAPRPNSSAYFSARQDLDLITRQDFLNHLKVMSERDGVTIIYATHIFDGLDGWASHLAFIANGAFQRFGRVETFDDLTAMQRSGVYSPLLRTVEQFMRAHRATIKAAAAAVGEEVKEKAGRVMDESLTGEMGNGYLPGRLGGKLGYN